MPIATTSLAIDDCTLNIRHVGKGQPLLWLHGTDGLTDWPAIIDRLAERHEVIVPDHPGFGESSIPGWMDDVSDLAYLYLDLVKTLALDRVHVVGHSLGGWIALEMAVRQTQPIAALTLIAPAGLHVKGAAKTDIFMIDPDEQARMTFADAGLADKAAERAGAAKYQEIAIANRVASARFGWNPRFHNPRLERWLHRVDVPTTVVWGRQDRIFSPAHAEAYGRAIPGSKVVLIDGAGHLPHVERQAEVLHLLADAPA